MQISKTFLVVCTVAGCAGSFCFAAPDSLSQAQAREALRQKMAELNAQESSAQTPAAKKSSPKKETTSAPESQPVVQDSPVNATAATAPSAATVVVAIPPSSATTVRASTEETARQREALRQKMAELNAQEKGGQPPPAGVVWHEEDQRKAAAEAKASKANGGNAKFEPVPGFQSAAFAPIGAPPPAVPPAKEAKLDDLLRRYKADEITPEDYHKQRAKILAEP